MQYTKYILGAVIVVGAIYIGWNAIQTKPSETIPQATVTDTTVTTGATNTENQAPTSGGRVRPVDNENVKIAFTGFGPGKEHNGTFSKVTSNLSLTETGSMTGTIIVDVASLSTDNERVTKHLNTADFFDTAKYPTATFALTKIAAGKATGTMTIRGIKKEISFPIAIQESEPIKYAATFTLDMKDFGINQTFANEVIELSVTVPLK